MVLVSSFLGWQALRKRAPKKGLKTRDIIILLAGLSPQPFFSFLIFFFFFSTFSQLLMEVVSKRPRSSSQLATPVASQNVVMVRRGKSKLGLVWARSARKGKKRVPVLFVMQTIALGFQFPQADTFAVPFFTKLHYNVVADLNATGTAGTFMPEVQYRLNNIYDPVVAVGGGQPYYYDTLFGSNGTSAPYRNWRVIKTRVDILWYNDNTSASASMMCGATVGLDLNATAQTVAASQLAMQRPNTRIIPVMPNASSGAVAGMTIYVDHKQLLGVTNMKDADDQIGYYNAGQSGQEVTLQLFTFPIDTASTSTIQMWYRLHITYTVECRTLNTVTES